MDKAVQSRLFGVITEKDARLKKESKKALIGINLSTVQVLTANYGFQYSQNLIKKQLRLLVGIAR